MEKIKLITKEELKKMREEVDGSVCAGTVPIGREYWKVNRIVSSLEAAYDIEECDHKFVYIETTYGSDLVGLGTIAGSYTWKHWRIDRFFCEHCIESREVQKEEVGEGKPEWWEGKR